MAEYIIRGGNRLSGRVDISGAKNAVLPIAAAALLTEGAVIHNCPYLLDVRVCMDIIRSLGCVCSFRSGVLYVEPYGLSGCEVSAELCGKMRSSVTFLGALLARCGEAAVYCPGGCTIGSRPVDIHLAALAAMGAEVIADGDRIYCRGRLHGADITLRYPSVGATENTILAAATAEGTTVLHGCAAEPEIADLASFLNASGADIRGAGSREIRINGVPRLRRCEYTVMGDRIEAGTYMCAAAITGGELFINGADISILKQTAAALRKTGCVIKASRGHIYIDSPERLSAVDGLVTAPYPGFPTDMQSQMTAVLCLAKGKSSIEERVFDARTAHIPELNKMGADISCTDGKSFCINGVEHLTGCEVVARDLRGGAALILAGLAAEGTTTVRNARYIMRGYERLAKKLANVGAEIEYRE